MARRSATSISISILAVALTGAGTASAEETAPARDQAAKPDPLQNDRATALLREGRRLAQEERYGEACERFEQSLSLVAGIGTQFNLADCYEHIGRTASAQALFGRVAEAAAAAGQSEREMVARERVAALETRLTRLTLDVRSPAPRQVIRKNRIEVSADTWGRAVPVDPGVYEIEATAPGHKPWTTRVRVAARPSPVIVGVPPLEAEVEAVAEKHERPKMFPRTEPSRSESEVKRGGLPFASLGLAALGIGGLATGTVFALKYRDANDEAESICVGDAVCTRADIDRHSSLVDDSRDARLGMYIGYGAGAAALVAAAITYFSRGSSGPDSDGGVAATPLVGPDGSWGMTVRSKF